MQKVKIQEWEKGKHNDAKNSKCNNDKSEKTRDEFK
jgi:hypothetical protein